MKISNLKLKYQIILIISLSIVILLSMEFFYYNSFFKLTQTRAIEYENKLIEQTQAKIDSALDEVKKNTSSIVYDNKVQQVMVNFDNYQRETELAPYVMKLIEYMQLFDSFVDGICISDNFDRQISTINISTSKKYQQFINTYIDKLQGLKKGEYTTLYDDGISDGAFFFYIAPIIGTAGSENFSSNIGYCSVMISASKIQALIENTEFTKNSLVYILDGENKIITSNKTGIQESLVDNILNEDTESLEKGLKTKLGGQDVIVQQKNLIQAAGWRIVSIIPVNELTQDMNPIRNISIIASAGIFLCLIIIWGFLFRSITRTIMELINDMKKIGEKEIKTRIKVCSTNEIGIVAAEINAMLDKIEEMTRNIFITQARLYEAELRRKQAEFSSLQSQINPHFLYNTLNCISSIGLAYGSEEIAQMTSCLTKIFRYNIKSQELVSISEEIESISAYINIISIRYSDKYRIEMKVDDKILEMKTPKMILQPIVENSIFHGLENIYKGGQLSISGYIDNNNDIIFEVFDTGKGINKDKLSTIKEKLGIDYSEILKTNAEGRIGLVNINSRIKLLFGEKYGIDIESEDGFWTKVTIKIPIIQGEVSL